MFSLAKYIKVIGVRLLIIGINIIEIVLVFIPNQKVSLSKWTQELERLVNSIRKWG